MTPKVELTDDELSDRPRRRSDESTPAKTLGIAVVVVGLVGSVFGAGYNWRSVSIVELKQMQLEQDYVRKDVQNEQLQILRYQLSELSRQFEEVRAELKSQRRKE